MVEQAFGLRLRSACGCEEAAATAWRPAGKGHSDSVVPPAVADFFWHDSTAPPSRSHVSSSRAHRLSRLTAPRAARCRGGSRRRGRSGRIWDLVFDRLADKKPHTSSIRCRGLRSSASTRSFVLGLRPADFGACVFFVFRLADMRDGAGHRRFPARG